MPGCLELKASGPFYGPDAGGSRRLLAPRSLKLSGVGGVNGVPRNHVFPPVAPHAELLVGQPARVLTLERLKVLLRVRLPHGRRECESPRMPPPILRHKAFWGFTGGLERAEAFPFPSLFLLTNLCCQLV